jgi:hypothetical protein
MLRSATISDYLPCSRTMRRRRGNFGVLAFRGVDPDQCGYLRARFVGPGELIYINGSNAPVT